MALPAPRRTLRPAAVICAIEMTGAHDGRWSGLGPTGLHLAIRAAAFSEYATCARISATAAKEGG